MSTFNAILHRVEGFLSMLTAKYRDAYLAQLKNLPDDERKTGHRGVFLP